MKDVLIPECSRSYAWSIEEVRELLCLHDSGADIETLGFYFPASGGQILHQLFYLYFGICCPDRGPGGSRHGQIWSPVEDRELDAMYARGLSVSDISIRLGRSERAICSRLVEDWRAVIPAKVLISLGVTSDGELRCFSLAE